MIYFKDIRWKNLLSTGNQFTEVQLNKSSTTLIVGDNGSGKSTVLDALCFGLFNKPFRRITKPQLINSINNGGLLVEPVFTALFSGDVLGLTGRLGGFGYTSIILLIMIVIKILGNCITVGSGMSAGFTGPSALVGMLLGVSASLFLGIELGSPTYFAFIAAGFAGMLSSSMNVPLAAAIISIEVFGLQYSFPAAVSSVIGFQMMRNNTIYDYIYNEQ